MSFQKQQSKLCAISRIWVVVASSYLCRRYLVCNEKTVWNKVFIKSTYVSTLQQEFIKKEQSKQFGNTNYCSFIIYDSSFQADTRRCIHIQCISKPYKHLLIPLFQISQRN